jgi:signal transduction histidine kinase
VDHDGLRRAPPRRRGAALCESEQRLRLLVEFTTQAAWETYALGDPLRLRQVPLNLLSNVVKSRPPAA